MHAAYRSKKSGAVSIITVTVSILTGAQYTMAAGLHLNNNYKGYI